MTAHDPTEAALVWFALFFAVLAVAAAWEWLAVRVARHRRELAHSPARAGRRPHDA